MARYLRYDRRFKKDAHQQTNFLIIKEEEGVIQNGVGISLSPTH